MTSNSLVCHQFWHKEYNHFQQIKDIMFPIAFVNSSVGILWMNAQIILLLSKSMENFVINPSVEMDIHQYLIRTNKSENSIQPILITTSEENYLHVTGEELV